MRVALVGCSSSQSRRRRSSALLPPEKDLLLLPVVTLTQTRVEQPDWELEEADTCSPRPTPTRPTSPGAA